MVLPGPRKKKPELVYIEWEDPATEHAGWFELTDDVIDKLGLAQVKSVGWIIKENKKLLILSGHLIEKDNMGSCDVSIPKASITRKVKLNPEDNK